jgi:hypothetical protein
MARKHTERAPRREDPGLSWCHQCHGVVIASETGSLLSPMGEKHDCATTTAHLAAIGAAWITQPDGSAGWVWLEPHAA